MNEDLFDRFPDMTPVRAVPSMGLVNGIGTSLHGRRDFDADTGTYVKTYTFCLLFIPVLALKAFRVADAPGGGFYFLGRVPLSTFARGWNILLLIALVAGGAGIWNYQRTHTPEYLAAQKLEEADAHAAAGDVRLAAESYRSLLNGPKYIEAGQRLKDMLHNLPEDSEQAAFLLKYGLELQSENKLLDVNLYKKGTDYAAKHRATNPAAAFAILDVVAPLAQDEGVLVKEQEKLLEALVKAKPDDMPYATRLAAICAGDSRTPRAKSLLAPFADRLGTTDGAAILGRILANEGESDKAFLLLEPYVAKHLPALQAAEQQYMSAMKNLQQTAFSELQNGSAAGFDYTTYRASGQKVQEEMFDAYMSQRFKTDAQVRGAMTALMETKNAVPAALDLGLLQLQRGRAANDAAARQRELQAAEKTFLAVRGVAGESPDYKLMLGQVYYWLGKTADGRKLIGEVLKANPTAEVTMAAVGVLREVGAVDEARKIAETAWKNEPNAVEKMRIAGMRSLLFTDLDDEILWLGRCNQSNPETTASLAGCQGHKARQEGRYDDAKSLYEKAVAVYDGMPETAASLNNSALYLSALHTLTNEPAVLARATDRLDRALRLKSSDSILLINSISLLRGATARAAIGAEIDLAALNATADWSMLAFLYQDDATYDAVYGRLKQHPGLAKCRGYAEKLMLLSPRSTEGYDTLDTVLYMSGDEAGLKRLAEQTKGLDLRDDAARDRQADYLAGKDDTRLREDARKAVARTKATLEKVKGRKDATYAWAVSSHVRAVLATEFFGDKFDYAALSVLADGAYAAAPSWGAHDLQAEILLRKAHSQLTADVPEYAADAKLTRRSFGPNLVMLYLGRDGPVSDKVRSHAAVTPWLAMLAGEVRMLPRRANAIDAVLLRAAEPTLAKAASDALTANAAKRLSDEVRWNISRGGVDDAIRRYFALLHAGKKAEADAVIADLAKENVPVPKFGS